VRWAYLNTNPDQVQLLAEALGGHSSVSGTDDPQNLTMLARLLVARGITEPEAAVRFLAPSLAHLHSPYLMAGVKQAVDRIAAAIERKESILIYGDYDVDGTTAIIILKTAIELCGGAADFHVPHRIRDGYDMRGDVIESAAACGVQLIISVDMGIRAFGPAETARNLGVDLIVTDHHLPGPEGIPSAFVVVNPNQSGCDYPCKAICGAGVAFKLAHGLMERKLTEKDVSRLLLSFMKVVAIATIADSVPLRDENRVFAKLGLEALRSAVNPGLKALLEVAQVGGRPLTAGEVGFRIAPRLNAAGRMDVARDVIELFSVKDSARAREIATRLDQLNAERQEEERRILASIESRLEEEPLLRDAFCMVIDGDNWHRGVIGITATRVVERYGRPALVISRNGEDAHGSGRSIRAFHLLNALESCSGLFTRYGGHAYAVGFSLPTARIPELRRALDEHAHARMTAADLEPMLEIGDELLLDQVSPSLFQTLRRLEPYGAGNHQPVFCAEGVRLGAPPRIVKDKHVKLKLCPALEASNQRSSLGWRKALTFDALGWHMAERINQEQLLPGDTLDIAFTIENNERGDFGGLELCLRDFRSASANKLFSQKKAVAADGS
jgi:single-stranded-DNA-specific exonuclease